jgi:Terminase RNaseH-like domain
LSDLTSTIKDVLRSIVLFCAHASGLTLRLYQEAAALAIVDSVINKRGLSFVVIFPRQSGKNELQAQIEAYLLTLFSPTPAEIVKVSPTWKPQSLNAMRRLERVLKRNLITRSFWSKESGYIYRMGDARIFFFSGSPTANIVGATASTLLEIDEAQDISAEKYDKEIAPMAASTNATRVFWGTAWTSQTLLAREKRLALAAQKVDGIQRLFQVNADQVGEEVPAYYEFVKSQIASLGRNHPFVRTQFFCEEIDDQSGMFTAERLALMQGSHPPQVAPRLGAVHLFTLDVGGESFSPLPEGRGAGGEDIAGGEGIAGDEGRARRNHDSTALTIFEVDLVSFAGIIHQPRFLVVQRVQWTGAPQTSIFKQLTALVDLWKPHRIVVDATGVGEGIAGMLSQAFGSQVIPFKFTQHSKSQLGWDLLAAIETGRFKDYACTTPGFSVVRSAIADQDQIAIDGTLPLDAARLQVAFLQQARFCQMEILPGPGKILRWQVPAGTRDPTTGELVHDDLLISAALCCVVDGEQFGPAESTVIKPPDPISQALEEKVF